MNYLNHSVLLSVTQTVTKTQVFDKQVKSKNSLFYFFWFSTAWIWLIIGVQENSIWKKLIPCSVNGLSLINGKLPFTSVYLLCVRHHTEVSIGKGHRYGQNRHSHDPHKAYCLHKLMTIVMDKIHTSRIFCCSTSCRLIIIFRLKKRQFLS